MPARKERRTAEVLGAERLLQAKLPADLVKALRMLALEQDTTVKELLARILRDYLAQQHRPAKRRG